MTDSSIKVERLPDGQVFVAKETWSDTFPEERREPWAQWYEKMYRDSGYEGYRTMAESLRALDPVGPA